MKNNRKLITTAIALILSVGTLGSQILAQKRNDSVVGKAGNLHISSTVRAGDVLLKPGMYEVQHVLEGEDNVIVFTEMKMPGPFEKGRTMHNSIRTEVARVKCRIELVGKKWKDTKLHIVRNNSRQRVVTGVQIAGEAVLYKLDSQL